MKARRFTLKKSSKGFTLIELMIVTAIIGVLAGIAIPFFLKYQFDAQEAEATQMLMAAWKDQQRVAAECEAGVYAGCDPRNKFTDALDSTTPGKPTLFYRPASRTVQFNLITGSTLADAGSRYSLLEMGYQIKNYPAAPINAGVFGMRTQSVWDPSLAVFVDQLVGDNFVFGAEGVLNGRLHVIAVTAQGNLIKICDAWTGQPNPAGQALVNGITGRAPACNF